MLALSLSISAKTSPALTGSPSFFIQERILPWLMVSLSFGISMMMATPVAPSLSLDIKNFPGRLETSSHAGKDGAFEGVTVGHGHVERCDPLHRRIQIVVASTVNALGNLRPDPTKSEILLDDHHSIRLSDRAKDDLFIQRLQGAGIDDFRLDAILRQFLGDLEGHLRHHLGPGYDGQVIPRPLDLSLSQG